MKIYRLETPLGLGPYSLGIVHKHRRSMGPPGTEMNRCPLPYDDIPKLWKRGRGPYPNEIFGFVSMKSLWAWFGDCLEPMMTHDTVRVVIYKVPKKYVVKGKKQVLFSHGIRLKTWNWKEVEQWLSHRK